MNSKLQEEVHHRTKMFLFQWSGVGDGFPSIFLCLTKQSPQLRKHCQSLAREPSLPRITESLLFKSTGFLPRK